MNELPKDDATKAKLQVLFFQLNEILKDPPTILDFPEWKDNISYVMDQIKELSELVYNRLDDLVTELIRRGENHVSDLDVDAAPQQTERSAYKYFEQLAYIESEINSLKSL